MKKLSLSISFIGNKVQISVSLLSDQTSSSIPNYSSPAMQLDRMRGFAWAKLINARPFKRCGRYLILDPDNPAARLAGVVDTDGWSGFVDQFNVLKRKIIIATQVR